MEITGKEDHIGNGLMISKSGVRKTYIVVSETKRQLQHCIQVIQLAQSPNTDP